MSHILVATQSDEDIARDDKVIGRLRLLVDVILSALPLNSAHRIILLRSLSNSMIRGSKLFEEITDRKMLVSRLLFSFLTVIRSAPLNVNEKISGGKAVIQGNFTISEVVI